MGVQHTIEVVLVRCTVVVTQRSTLQNKIPSFSVEDDHHDAVRTYDDDCISVQAVEDFLGWVEGYEELEATRKLELSLG